MKYSKEERIEIGREVYTKQLSPGEAAMKYNINRYTARGYARMYRECKQLPKNSQGFEEYQVLRDQQKAKYGDLSSMSKNDLIDEVIKARIEVKRTKKGYAVEGGGQEKVFTNLSDSNSK